ncbi:MAG: hypothetical protein JOZ70_01620 [Pseudolabrys sp.]|nr:hypothetical protein [Pseudolabrys sp.]MBV9953923.1 hypothetical protein [Pseudolabrys sp.]
MNESTVKAAVDAFLRNVSFTARNEIEKAVRAAFNEGKLDGKESVNAAIALSSDTLGLNVTIYSKIAL